MIAATPPADGHWDILSAGRLIPEKRLDLLIDAVPGLVDDFPSLRVLVIGDGPERMALEHLAHRRGIQEHVTFAGFVPDPAMVIGFMKSAGVFVSPSIREGFGMAALEAMACGMPVVTVDHPRNAVRERINTMTGRVASLTSEDLGEKILDCLRDPARFRQGCTAMAAAYDWEVILPQLERDLSEDSRLMARGHPESSALRGEETRNPDAAGAFIFAALSALSVAMALKRVSRRRGFNSGKARPIASFP